MFPVPRRTGLQLMQFNNPTSTKEMKTKTMTTLHLRKSIDQSSCRGAFLLIPLVIACLICANVQAAPVTWTLTNVTLTDNGSLTGSFEYNATTNPYSNILIRHIPD